MCVCVFFPFILDIKFVGRTSRGHTGFLIHLLSAVRALFYAYGSSIESTDMSGRNLLLYCTLALITMQGPQKQIRKVWAQLNFVTLGLGSDGFQHYKHECCQLEEAK